MAAIVRVPIRMAFADLDPIEVGTVEVPARPGELGFIVDEVSMATAFRQAADKLAPNSANEVYRERARLVAHLAGLYPSVLAYSDPNEPDWPVLTIQAPTGQLSWHISPDDLDLFSHVEQVEADDPRARWDSHTTEQKYERLAALIPPALHRKTLDDRANQSITGG